MAEEIEYYVVAKELAGLPEDTDSRDWPWAKKFLYELNLPQVWSQICLLTFGLARNPVIQIWLLIEYVNGWRRQLGKWDMQVAIQALEEIKRRITRLPPDHPRAGRLLEMFLYHLGLVRHANGEFSEAADCHEIAAQRAKNEWEKLLSLFHAASERLNAAICGKGEIAFCYAKFTEASQNFLAILAGDFSDKGIRWHNNVYCHLIFYAWVVEGKYPSKGEVAFLDELLESLAPAFADAAVVLQALCEFPASPERAAEITSRISLVAEIDWYTFAKLVQISALSKMGKSAELEAVREGLDDFLKDRHGGHIAWAILKHNLLK